MSTYIPVILCGGMGTRLWPLSRLHMPKQFISIQGKTLFASTLKRLQGLEIEDSLIIASEAHRFFVAEEIEHGKPAYRCTTLLEPVGRDTAPATALGAMHILKTWGNRPMVVMPSDHVMTQVEQFQKTLKAALANLESDSVVTLGIAPDAPKTGYGYLEQGEDLGNDLYAVRAFHEKPDSPTAKLWLKQGGYFWNSGIFILYAQHYLDLLQQFAPEILQGCEATYATAHQKQAQIHFSAETFFPIQKISCDYAVMEKAEKIRMMVDDMGWNDVGSWQCLGRLLEYDGSGNAVYGDVVVQDAKDNIIYGNNRLVGVFGVDNCVIAETVDAVLVTSRDQADNLKQLVEEMQSLNLPEVEWGRRVFRPWGSYEQIDHGENFQVKRLVIKPGQQLSLQMHHHRAEHWVVVQGTARVTRDEEVFDLKENESTYIPVTSKHRLENLGTEDLFLIEVQCGNYLGEDDIVRFEDVYGRS